MKIRSGFVSNSSSSSFVVAVKEGETKITVTTEFDLADSARATCRTIEDLNEHFLEEWAYGHDSIEEFLNDSEEVWATEHYKKAKEAIENGKVVMFGSFESYGEGPVESMLCDNGLKGIVDEDKIEIIYSEGGY